MVVNMNTMDTIDYSIGYVSRLNLIVNREYLF